MEHGLGIQQWDGQRRVMRALQQHRTVAVMSGHKVGKTHTVGSIVNTVLPLYPHSRIITSAATNAQLRENVWGEIRAQRSAALFPPGGHLMPRANEWQMGDQWYAVGISTDNPESFQGKHSERGLVLIILDECQSIQREIWTAARTMTADENGYLLVIANPTIPSGPFWDACTTDSGFHVEQLSVYDHPNIIEGRKVMPGPTMDLVRAFQGTPDEGPRLRGEFNQDGADNLISLAGLIACGELQDTDLEHDGLHIGVDIADQGGDECVAVITEGRDVVEVERWVSKGADGLMATAGRIQALAARWECPPECVHVDGIGVGAGVVARLHELGFGVDNVNFGAGPVGEWAGVLGEFVEFANRRAELYWVARTLIEGGSFRIRAEFRDVIADLAAPSWSYISDRKVKIEPKDKIRARIGRSPDAGDALVLSLSRTASRVPRIRRLL